MKLSLHSHRSAEIEALIKKTGLDRFEMGLAIVDLNQLGIDGKRNIFGYNIDHLIYPASVSKIFIAAEMFRLISIGDYRLEQEVDIRAPNDVDVDPAIFRGDTRQLLRAGDIVTIEYLLDLMLSRSDNTASNELITLVSRDGINENIIAPNGWQGSEVTRKYMPIEYELPKFQNALPMKSCARHVAEFFTTLADGNFWIRTMLAKYMGKYDHGDREGLWLPGSYNYYLCKGGRHSGLLRDGRNAHWLHDVGIVAGLKSCYVVAVMTVDKNRETSSTFPMRELAQTLFDYMESYKY